MTAMVPSGAAESSQPCPLLGQDLAPPSWGQIHWKITGLTGPSSRTAAHDCKHPPQGLITPESNELQ